MKKTIGWILLILGIIAIFGGLTSKVQSEFSVELIGYLFKFGLIIGGIVLITSQNNNKKTNSTSDSVIIPNKDNNLEKILSGSNKQVSDDNSILKKNANFRLREVEGFLQMPQEMIIMNKSGYQSDFLKILDPIPNDKRLMVMLTKSFFIPDNISIIKYFFNESYFTKNVNKSEEKFVSPTLKNFVDNIGSTKTIAFPYWFYCAYPDIAKWYIFGEGNKIIKNDFKDKLAYLSTNEAQAKAFGDFIKTEFYENPLGEDFSIKIRPDILRELIIIYKRNRHGIMLECECD